MESQAFCLGRASGRSFVGILASDTTNIVLIPSVGEMDSVVFVVMAKFLTNIPNAEFL